MNNYEQILEKIEDLSKEIELLKSLLPPKVSDFSTDLVNFLENISDCDLFDIFSEYDSDFKIFTDFDELLDKYCYDYAEAYMLGKTNTFDDTCYYHDYHSLESSNNLRDFIDHNDIVELANKININDNITNRVLADFVKNYRK